MNKLDQLRVTSRLIPLEPGLHIFRFATELPDGENVQIALQHSPVGKGQVDFFPAEGVTRNTLTRLGDCVIARVKSGPVGILVTEFRTPHSHTVVDLRLDRIDTSANIVRKKAKPAPQPAAVPASAAIPPPVAPLKPVPAADPRATLRLGGHVQGRGAVQLSSRGDEWLGDPAGTQALEGFAIAWPGQPEGVDLIYTCRVHKLGQMPATRAGSYVGTRNKNLPILSISFLLAGPRAGEYELSGQVAFSGSPPQALQPGVALTGPSGREPLVALRPHIVAKSSSPAARASAPSRPDAAKRRLSA